MSKTVRPSKLTEWKGLDRISALFHEMPGIYREISKDDFGVDAEVEMVIPKSDGSGYATHGGIIKVQVKSGASYIKGDSASRFHTPVEKQDLLTWNSATFPVIFVVYHPTDDCLYWKDVKTYVKSTPGVFQPPLHIVFDKALDRLQQESYDALCRLAQISPPRISFEQREQLYSNLLFVKKRPGVITHAPTTFRDVKEIRQRVERSIPPCVLANGRLYTLTDLRDAQCTLREFCDTNAICDLNAREWEHDEARRKDYVSLLNQLLRKHAGRCGIRYNPEFNRYYFPREDETSPEFKRNWYNIRTNRQIPERLVAKHYEYGADEFWRHLAANLRFRYLGSSWYLEIVPKYFFTDDGVRPCNREKVGPYTTKIKAKERNNHVLNHTLFWIDVLSQSKENIEVQLQWRPLLLIDKHPVTGLAAFAIPSDPAVYEEPPTAEQLGLFEHLFPMPLEEDDDEYYH